MDVMDMVARTRDTLDTQHVFGEPITRDGVTVIPVARIAGGGGAGTGQSAPSGAETAAESGTGGGFGLGMTAAGVFAVQDGKVTWRPAVDVNRVILGGQMVAIVALLVLRSYLRALAKHRH